MGRLLFSQPWYMRSSKLPAAPVLKGLSSTFDQNASQVHGLIEKHASKKLGPEAGQLVAQLATGLTSSLLSGFHQSVAASEEQPSCPPCPTCPTVPAQLAYPPMAYQPQYAYQVPQYTMPQVQLPQLTQEQLAQFSQAQMTPAQMPQVPPQMTQVQAQGPVSGQVGGGDVADRVIASLQHCYGQPIRATRTDRLRLAAAFQQMIDHGVNLVRGETVACMVFGPNADQAAFQRLPGYAFARQTLDRLLARSAAVRS